MKAQHSDTLVAFRGRIKQMAEWGRKKKVIRGTFFSNGSTGIDAPGPALLIAGTTRKPS